MLITLTETERRLLEADKKLDEEDVERVLNLPFQFIANRGPAQLENARYSLIPDGLLLQRDRMDVSFLINDSFHSFPFGKLHLTQAIEFLETNPDATQCVVIREIAALPGGPQTYIAGNWHFLSQKLTQPRTNVVALETTLQHNYVNIFFKFALPLVLITALSISIATSIHNRRDTEVTWRVAGQVTLLLVAITLRIAIGTELPQVDYLTFADIFWIFTLFVVTVSTIGTILLGFALSRNPKDAESAIVRRFRVLLLAGYVVIILGCVLLIERVHLEF
ncbi:hypothetical protein [Roseibium sp. RKSG952]|uniref:hypothetical protein n=1 Tax=Roseibium sp. RKSG952 TaxID=2529384 RepID=UPI0012BB5F75|nr:hypothetical protein [Roseibium sp. RKSG952]MTH96041.1 hypothetical protein [Roseibium sp. RKSG952]